MGGLSQRRASLPIVLPGMNEALFWDGRTLSRGSAHEVERLTITVSHRRLREGRGLPLLSLIEAAQTNSDNLKALSERAFTLPIALTVDGRRLDSLGRCPGYGYHRYGRPFGIGWGSPSSPCFRLPPGTFEVTAQAEGMVGLNELSSHFAQRQAPPEEVSLAWLHTLHFGPPRGDDESFGADWVLHQFPAKIFWLSQGVVVETETLHEIELSASVAIFLSAEGLESDLSGWSLVESPGRLARQREACDFISHRPGLGQLQTPERGARPARSG